MPEARHEFGEREQHAARVLVELAIAEDLSQIGDITSAATIPSHARGAAQWWHVPLEFSRAGRS